MVEEGGPTATYPHSREQSREQSKEQVPNSLANTLPLTEKKNRADSLDYTGGREDNNNEILNFSGIKSAVPSALGLTHRRLSSWSQASNGASPISNHRRQQSLVSGHSSKSTSAYSTLSERSTAGSMEGGGGEADSMGGSLRGRPAVVASTSSRVEQSRVNPQAVIDNLFSSHNFSRSEAGLNRDQGGLKLYVDKSLGTVTLAGPNLDRYA